MCQRFIDRDFSQNHGSRPIPIADEGFDAGTDTFLPKSCSTPNYLSKSPHHRSKPVKNVKQRRDFSESSASRGWKEKQSDRKRARRCGRMNPNRMRRDFLRNFDSDSENYLGPNESGVVSLDVRNRFDDNGQRLGHRRAFSDVDRSYVFRADENETDSLTANKADQENPSFSIDENIDETMISTTDQAILRLVVSRGCMTEKRNDFSAYSVL